jgi:flagellar basal body-associated protein FliL
MKNTKLFLIVIIAVMAMVAIVVLVVVLKPSSNAEEAILKQQPVAQKNLISDIGGVLSSVFSVKG